MNKNPSISSLKLDLINNCNFRCSFCPYYGKGEAGGRVISSNGVRIEPLKAIDLDVLTNVFKELSQEKLFPTIKISGWGEGLLHPDFDSIVHNAHDLGFKIRMISNGYSTEKHLDAILCNLDTYIVSIHGSPKIHNEIVQVKNAYNKTLTGLTKLLESSNEKRSLSKIILTFTITPDNIIDLANQAELIKNLQKKSSDISVQARFQHDYLPFSNYAHTKKTYNLKLLGQQLTKVKNMLAGAVEILPDITGDLLEKYYSRGPFILNPHKCVRVAQELEIRSNGDAYTCMSGIFGNIYQQSILDILHGKNWSGFVEKIQKEADTPKGLSLICDRCHYQAEYILPLNKR